MKDEGSRKRKLKKINYSALNSKQQENYNFQKVAALLADYGFNCMRLSDDWQGADFLAYHVNGKDTLKVQLKSRLTISKKYRGRGVHIAFPIGEVWYLLEHVRLTRIVDRTTGWRNTTSWTKHGGYSSPHPGKTLENALAPYKIGTIERPDKPKKKRRHTPGRRSRRGRKS